MTVFEEATFLIVAAAVVNRVTVRDIMASGRGTKRTTMARAHAAREMRARGYTTVEIGEYLGRDHSSVVTLTNGSLRKHPNFVDSRPRDRLR